MEIKTGVDLIYLPKFKKAAKFGGENFLRRVFLADELKNQQIEHLAGIFASKEAVMKALNLPSDSWQDIIVVDLPSGEPRAEIRNLKFEIRNYSLSISHDGNYVIACFVAILNEQITS